MKKILLSTFVLIAFALSVVIFQLSCKKDVIAQEPAYTVPIASTTKLGGVMVDGTTIIIDKQGKISSVPIVIEYSDVVYIIESGIDGDPELWKINMDGTMNQRLPIALPAGLAIDPYNIGFKRTLNKIIFGAKNKNSGDQKYIFTCNVDGTELRKVLEVNDDFVL